MKQSSLRLAARIVLASLVLAAILPASAQRRTFRTDPAQVDSTYSVFPQINETFSTRPMRPSNPRITIGQGPANTMSLNGGIVKQYDRIAASTRFPGITSTGWDPPDPTLAVGPSHIVVTVNSAVAFFTKTGTRTFQQDLGPRGFFASVNPTNFVFDPKVFYDQVARRFVIVAPELDQSGQQSKCLVAVSDDSDPNGTWFKYRIEAKTTSGGNSFWFDYPGFGYNKDAFVITGNMFPFSGGGFGGVQFIILPKAPMLDGSAVNATSITENTFTVQVCHTMDANLDRLYAISTPNNTSVELFCILNMTGSPQIRRVNLSVPRYNGNSVAVSRNNARLDTVGSRLISSYYRAGKVVAAHTVGTSQSDTRAAVRWYEVDVRNWPASGLPQLAQSGQLSPPTGQHYWMPGICSNKSGDISIVFNRCSTSISADMMVAGRKSTDPAGTMGAPKLMVSSAGAYGSGNHRWGDYAETCTDPTDDNTFWGIVHTIGSNNRWGTEIQKWTVTVAGGGADVAVPIAVTPLQGSYVRGSVQSTQQNDEGYYEVASVPVARLGNVAAAEMTFRLTRPASQIGSIDVLLETLTDLPVNATGMIWLYNWSTNQWDHKKSFPLAANGQGSMTYTLGTGISQYVNGSREVKLAVRGLTSINSRSARPFTIRVDLAQMALSTL